MWKCMKLWRCQGTHKGYTYTRLYDCEGIMLDQDVRMWQIGMCRLGGSACVSKSYNIKRKSCNM